jgi:hypothetical protein
VPAAHEKSIAMLAHKSATLKIGKADTFEDVKCPDKQGWLHYANDSTILHVMSRSSPVKSKGALVLAVQPRMNLAFLHDSF